MLQQANHLERDYGAGPHTISVPRMRPADGSDVSPSPLARSALPCLPPLACLLALPLLGFSACCAGALGARLYAPSACALTPAPSQPTHPPTHPRASHRCRWRRPLPSTTPTLKSWWCVLSFCPPLLSLCLPPPPPPPPRPPTPPRPPSPPRPPTPPHPTPTPPQTAAGHPPNRRALHRDDPVHARVACHARRAAARWDESDVGGVAHRRGRLPPVRVELCMWVGGRAGRRGPRRHPPAYTHAPSLPFHPPLIPCQRRLPGHSREPGRPVWTVLADGSSPRWVPPPPPAAAAAAASLFEAARRSARAPPHPPPPPTPPPQPSHTRARPVPLACSGGDCCGPNEAGLCAFLVHSLLPQG